jgi:2-desacetyl-2-hydroxyethyl bacteriochlorophyllide A dehydrogenase
MRQVILAEPGRFEARDVPPPGDPPDGQVRVRIRRIGVCGTDLHAFTGRQPFFEYPRVLGHELAVEVVQLGNDVEGLAIGDVCAVEPYLNCGDCPMCAVGRTNCCERLRVLGIHIDGGMTDELIVPVDKLYPSKSLTLDQLALVETLGIGRHAVNRARLEIFEPVLVVGAGPIGLATAQFAKAAGAEVTVLDTSPTRRAFAERFGFTVVPETEARFNVVFDATGSRHGAVHRTGGVRRQCRVRRTGEGPRQLRRPPAAPPGTDAAGQPQQRRSLRACDVIDRSWCHRHDTVGHAPADAG